MMLNPKPRQLWDEEWKLGLLWCITYKNIFPEFSC